MTRRRTEVAVTGLTRNQFISLLWYKGSNPFVSAFFMSGDYKLCTIIPLIHIKKINTDVKYINFPFPQGFPALTETEKSVMAVVSSVVTEVQVNLPPPAMKLSLIKLKMLKKGYLTKLRTANLLPIFSLLPTLTVKFPT